MIARAARALPPQMPAPPSYQKVNPGDQPVLFLVLRSATLPLSIDQRVRRVDDRAAHLDGQRRRAGAGVRRREVRGPHRRRSAQARGARHRHRRSRQRRSRTPTSSCRPARCTARSRPSRCWPTASCCARQAYGPMIVAYRNGNPVRLEEVAHVYDGVENDKNAAWYGRASARSTWRSRSSRAPTSSRSSTRSKTLLPAFREQLPAAAVARHPQRSLGRDPRVGPRRQVHAADHGRARRPGDLPVPAEPLGHDHSEPRAAGLDRRDLRGDVPARLQPRQPVADGADALRSASSWTTRS